MALILNIDTALQTGSVCLSRDAQPLAYLQNTEPSSQASWIHEAIRQLMQECHLQLHELNAVAVSNGPGSYTGLRIGLATAKGICYTLKIPLICVNTLFIMASSVSSEADDLICPMIDARRMEVFTTLYDKQLNTIEEQSALVVTEKSFEDYLSDRKVLFTGNGSLKFQQLTTSENARFLDQKINAIHMLPIAAKMFEQQQFSDLAYVEPEYVKAVYTS